MSEAVQVVILAGGASRRYGQDKAQALFAGVPMLTRLLQQLRLAGHEPLIQGRLPTSEDDWHGLADAQANAGPAAALHSAMSQYPNHSVLLLAVDLAALQAQHIHWLLAQNCGQHGCVPRLDDDHLQPCAALYRPCFALVLAASLATGRRSLHAAIGDGNLSHPRVPPHMTPALRGCNTPAEAAALLSHLESP